EAYSIAMMIREQMSLRKQEHLVQIFATDIDEQAIKRARVGLYPNNIAADVSPERLQRFFIKSDGTYQISKQIREMAVFAVQSVTKDPPFSRMDLISCRNLLIYLGPELQKKVIPFFHYSLKAGGFLFLGTSETLGDFDRFFHAIDRKAKLFQHDRVIVSVEDRIDFAAPALNADSISISQPRIDKPATVREVAEKLILQEFAPPCVIINARNEILYFQGKTSDYLEPSSGDASLNLFRMVREELRLPLSAAVRKAIEQRQEAVEDGVHLYNGDTLRVVDLIVKPVSGPFSVPQGLFMVVFEDRSPRKLELPAENASSELDERDQRLMETDRELQATREYLQSTVEQLETTIEELRSTNEELESSNEELHSTNEELETAKEELQSVNEELITVNSELQSKLDELTRSNDDLNNLLAAVEVGIIFLDTQLNILRFNPASTHLINLIQADIGRPMAHIVNNVTDDHLVADAQEVLETLVPREVEVETHDNRHYRVRIRPYRTIENTIDGLVITFTDITEQKRSEIQNSRARQYVESIVDTVRDPLLVLDQNLHIVLASRAFNQHYQTRQDDLNGKTLFEVGNGEWDFARLRQQLEQVVSANQPLEDFELEQEFPGQGKRKVRLTARHIYPEAGQKAETGQGPLILLVIEDFTDHADRR
ncbi:MAG TPA: CheR family methyltransferase, partial [Aggregatilineales bacterium]|nr:CheR family methyltransferase [Aggregatilineales bacterium]